MRALIFASAAFYLAIIDSNVSLIFILLSLFCILVDSNVS